MHGQIVQNIADHGRIFGVFHHRERVRVNGDDRHTKFTHRDSLKIRLHHFPRPLHPTDIIFHASIFQSHTGGDVQHNQHVLEFLERHRAAVFAMRHGL